MSKENETMENQILRALGQLNEKMARVEQIEKAVAEGKASQSKFESALADMQKTMLAYQKAQIAATRRSVHSTRAGFVSNECARALGAIAIIGACAQGHIKATDQHSEIVKDTLGLELKTALTSSDIPLPVDYASEVSELVSLYGAARQYGTVYPLGSASAKLPRLKTSPAFGLIAASGTVTEKGVQTEWVTFSPSKWGGLVRLPSEIDEDSIFGLGQFLARYAAREMAKIEDTVFFTADGTSTYDSLSGLTKSVITNSKVTTQASTKTKYSDATLANIRAIRAVVDAPAIALGAYYMHPSFEQHLSGLNSSGDKPYVANGARGATLDGYPIRWVDVMPAYSTSANAEKVFMLFGDLSFQYLGVRSGMRFDTSKEAGFTTDEVLVRALERFTIGLMATGAVSGLQTAAS